MTRWKGAAVLAVITAVLLYAIQLMPSEPVPSTPVMGIVSTAAEDDRREAQVRALVQAAEADGFEGRRCRWNAHRRRRLKRSVR